MLSSNQPSVDLAIEPSQDPDEAAPADAAPAPDSPPVQPNATARNQITPFPLPNLTPPEAQSAIHNRQSAILTPPPLSPQQQTAISLLLVGHSTPAAAAILGIHRTTLHRWKTQHPTFIAELNRRQAEALEAARTRLTNLLLKTLDLVHSSLTHGKPWEQIENAYKLFRMLPCRTLALTPIPGPTELEPAIDAAIRLQRATQNLPPDTPITHEDREHYLKTFQLPEDP